MESWRKRVAVGGLGGLQSDSGRGGTEKVEDKRPDLGCSILLIIGR